MTEEESEILSYIALKKERNQWSWRLRKALEKGDPPRAILELRKRIEALDDAIAKHEDSKVR